MQSQAETAVATHRNNPGKTFLNHFFVVLEPKDYEAIRTSDFLKNEYGVFERGRPSADDVTYQRDLSLWKRHLHGVVQSRRHDQQSEW